MKIVLKSIIFIFCIVLFTSSVAAEEINQVRWATSEWEGLTNKDGTGLYNEIMDSIFGPYQIKVTRKYLPWKRACKDVLIGDQDMTGGLDPTSDYFQSQYPIYDNYESVMFKKTTFPNWEGLQSLKKKKGVWVRGYVETIEDKALKDILKGQANNTRQGALKMLVAGRADYFFDSRQTLLSTIKKMKPNLDMNDYRIEHVVVIQLYMSFTKNKRGKKLRDLYDEGIRQLHQAGKLQNLYKKWKNPVPILEIK